jgi:hypothetical protein
VNGKKVVDADLLVGAFQKAFYYLLIIKYPKKVSRGWKHEPALMAAVLTIICDVNKKSEKE